MCIALTIAIPKPRALKSARHSSTPDIPLVLRAAICDDLGSAPDSRATARNGYAELPQLGPQSLTGDPQTTGGRGAAVSAFAQAVSDGCRLDVVEDVLERLPFGRSSGRRARDARREQRHGNELAGFRADDQTVNLVLELPHV